MFLTIQIPSKIQLLIKNEKIFIHGPVGSLIISRQKIDPFGLVKFKLNQSTCQIYIKRTNLGIQSTKYNLSQKALAGQIESFFKQSFRGVTQGYLVYLELHGVGFRVDKNEQSLLFKLGFSHSIHYELPNDIRSIMIDSTKFALYGIHLNRLTQIAASIKKLRLPEAYKGKGIRRSSDQLFLKERKKV